MLQHVNQLLRVLLVKSLETLLVLKHDLELILLLNVLSELLKQELMFFFCDRRLSLFLRRRFNVGFFDLDGIWILRLVRDLCRVLLSILLIYFSLDTCILFIIFVLVSERQLLLQFAELPMECLSQLLELCWFTLFILVRNDLGFSLLHLSISGRRCFFRDRIHLVFILLLIRLLLLK